MLKAVVHNQNISAEFVYRLNGTLVTVGIYDYFGVGAALCQNGNLIRMMGFVAACKYCADIVLRDFFAEPDYEGGFAGAAGCYVADTYYRCVYMVGF
jgi:hypothetical protein